MTKLVAIIKGYLFFERSCTGKMTYADERAWAFVFLKCDWTSDLKLANLSVPQLFHWQIEIIIIATLMMIM